MNKTPMEIVIVFCYFPIKQIMFEKPSSNIDLFTEVESEGC